MIVHLPNISFPHQCQSVKIAFKSFEMRWYGSFHRHAHTLTTRLSIIANDRTGKICSYLFATDDDTKEEVESAPEAAPTPSRKFVCPSVYTLL